MRSLYTLSPKKVSTLNILQLPQTCTDLNEILHTQDDIYFCIDVKFHKNPLFRLRDVQFFQTAGVKINGSYYRDTLLRQQLLPAIRSVSGDFFTFQQDSAQPTGPVRRLRYCQLRHPTSSAQWIGHRTGLNILTVLTDINCDGNS